MDVLTEKELCEVLKVSRQTLWRLRKREGVPFFKVGNRYRYNLDEVQQWLNRTRYKDLQLQLPLRER